MIGNGMNICGIFIRPVSLKSNLKNNNSVRCRQNDKRKILMCFNLCSKASCLTEVSA